MKAAAAVLGASLLFFLGVLTGAGRQEAVPPPVAIPLGVVDSTTGDGSSSSPPSSPSAPGGAARTTVTTRRPTPPAPTTPAAPPTPSPPEPSGSPGPPAETPAATAPATTPPDGATPSTTVRPGRVEEVDNQVDCTPADKKGKGRKDSCPSTTATTDPAGGGRGGQNG